jgi:hypothetical protein
MTGSMRMPTTHFPCDRCDRRISYGGNHTHSSPGRGIIDDIRQDSVPANVAGFVISGPVQFGQAASDRHYPSVTFTRTFVLGDERVLVVERVSIGDADAHSTEGWLRDDVGNETHSGIAKSVRLPMKVTPRSVTGKPGDSAWGADFGATPLCSSVVLRK